MAKHAVVRTDLLAGTDVRSELASVRYQPVDSESNENVKTAIDNGNVVKLGALEEGSRTVYMGLTPAANDQLRDIVLIATPEMIYCEHIHNIDEFENEAGVIARGYRLHSGDIFSVTKDALEGVETPEVGNVVELMAGTKLNVAASTTSGSTAVGKIIDINVVGRHTFYVIEVN